VILYYRVHQLVLVALADRLALKVQQVQSHQMHLMVLAIQEAQVIRWDPAGQDFLPVLGVLVGHLGLEIQQVLGLQQVQFHQHYQAVLVDLDLPSVQDFHWVQLVQLIQEIQFLQLDQVDHLDLLVPWARLDQLFQQDLVDLGFPMIQQVLVVLLVLVDQYLLVVHYFQQDPVAPQDQEYYEHYLQEDLFALLHQDLQMAPSVL
jgi:hypothetical protein